MIRSSILVLATVLLHARGPDPAPLGDALTRPQGQLERGETTLGSAATAFPMCRCDPCVPVTYQPPHRWSNAVR